MGARRVSDLGVALYTEGAAGYCMVGGLQMEGVYGVWLMSAVSYLRSVVSSNITGLMVANTRGLSPFFSVSS